MLDEFSACQEPRGTWFSFFFSIPSLASSQREERTRSDSCHSVAIGTNEFIGSDSTEQKGPKCENLITAREDFLPFTVSQELIFLYRTFSLSFSIFVIFCQGMAASIPSADHREMNRRLLLIDL